MGNRTAGTLGSSGHGECESLLFGTPNPHVILVNCTPGFDHGLGPSMEPISPASHSMPLCSFLTLLISHLENFHVIQAVYMDSHFGLLNWWFSVGSALCQGCLAMSDDIFIVVTTGGKVSATGM